MNPEPPISYRATVEAVSILGKLLYNTFKF